MNETRRLEYEGAGGDNANCSIIEFRGKSNPANHWTAPFVTGHTYYLRWEYGLDFEAMRFEIVEPLWNSDLDKDIQLEIPFYDVRSDIIVRPNIGDPIGNATLAKSRLYNKFGANMVYNETFEDDLLVPTQEKRLQLAISASNTNNPYADDMVSRIDLEGIRPADVDAIDETLELGAARNWSDPTAWPSGAIPVEGDNVVIDGSMNIILDLLPE